MTFPAVTMIVFARLCTDYWLAGKLPTICSRKHFSLILAWVEPYLSVQLTAFSNKTKQEQIL